MSLPFSTTSKIHVNGIGSVGVHLNHSKNCGLNNIIDLLDYFYMLPLPTSQCFSPCRWWLNLHVHDTGSLKTHISELETYGFDTNILTSRRTWTESRSVDSENYVFKMKICSFISLYFWSRYFKFICQKELNSCLIDIRNVIIFIDDPQHFGFDTNTLIFIIYTGLLFSPLPIEALWMHLNGMGSITILLKSSKTTDFALLSVVFWNFLHVTP